MTPELASDEIKNSSTENPYVNLSNEVIPLAARPADILAGIAEEAYPDEPAASALLMRKLLHGLTDADEERLAGYERVTGRIDRLEEVKLSQGRSIAVEPGDEAKYLITGQLNGCSVTVYIREYGNGAVEAAMTHFSPYARDEQVQKFDELAQQSDRPDQPVREHLVVLTEARRGGELAEAMKRHVGPDATVSHLTYDASDKLREDSGAVAVVLEADGQSSYHVGFQDGALL